MDCTQRPMDLNNVWFSLGHPGLLLCLQITVLLLHIHDGLLNLIVLADETHPTGLQLTQFISNLGLLVLSAPVHFLNCFLHFCQLSLYPVEHVPPNWSPTDAIYL